MTFTPVPLVRTKLVPPSFSTLLHRPTACEAIGRGLDCRLTLVSAPAGYGKTSALVDFAEHSPVPVCWYTADERDRDLHTFIHYLVGAIEHKFPGFGSRARDILSSLGGDLYRDHSGIVAELVNEMLDLDAPFVVVVDNYDSLGGGFGIRAFVLRLLDVLPHNCHLMLGSRAISGIPVTRLVAQRQLAGLTGSDLRFTAREVVELLSASRIEVSEARAQEMVTSAEGWITGVLLLSGLMRDDAAPGVNQKGRATSDTYDYLAREVLSRQAPDLQQFLCTSAVLQEMSSRLCHQILGVVAPAPLLAELERRSLFVTRFGKGAAAAYRYHNLFREFLESHLRQSDPVRHRELHHSAARYFERDDDVEQAVHHYLAADALSEGTALMERVAMEWFTRGRVETLLRWAGKLPEEARSSAPRLSLYQSKVLTDRYDYESARQALTYAEAEFKKRGDSARLANVHSQRAVLLLLAGRYGDVIGEAQRALAMLDGDDVVERAEALRVIGKAHVGLGRLADGIMELQDALSKYRDFGSPYDVVNLLQDLVAALTRQGRYDEAGTCLNEALAIGRRLGAAKQLAGVLNNLGCLQYDRGDYRESLALFEEGLAAAQRGGDLQWQAYISVGMADLFRDVGVYDRAEALYNAGLRIARDSEPTLAVYVLASQADMFRWQGDHVRARAFLDQATELAEAKGLSFERRGLLQVTEGTLLAESGHVEAGLRLLNDGVVFLKGRQARRELARAHFLLAKAWLLAHDRLSAVRELRLAMRLAEEIGTDQFAVAEGRHAEPLVALGLAMGVTGLRDVPERARRLAAFGREQIREKTGASAAPAGHLEIHALGEGRVIRDGQRVSSSDWQAAMARELFFYILGHGPLERDVIGAVFWPEASAKQMTDSFHTTLYRIRRAVGADAVVVDNGRYRLGDVDYWCDVEVFEDLVRRARLLPPYEWQTEILLRRAVDLYEGDFLPEVARVWCVPKRETLRDMYLEVLIGVGRCHEARKEPVEATRWYRRALGVDELREDVHRRIMRAYTDAGRRTEALAQYHRCKEILSRELSVETSIETRGLYEEIAGQTSA